MGDDAVAAQPEQRSAAVAVVAELLPDLAQRGAHEQRADLCERAAALDLPHDDVADQRRCALGELEHHVADEAVGHADVGDVVEDVAALDVTDEVQRRPFEQARRFDRLRVALDALLANRDDPDLRMLDAEHGARVRRAHEAELREPLGAAIDVRTAIEDDDRSVLGRIHDRDRRPRDPLDRTQAHERDREERAAVARRNDRVGAAVAHEVDCDAE